MNGGSTVRSDSRPFALLIVIFCLLAGNALVWIDRAGTPDRVRLVIDNPAFAPGVVASTSTIATTVVPSTTAAPPPGARNPAPPAPRGGASRSGARQPVVPIGTMEIPKIGLRHAVYEGNTLATIDHGPSHWPGTALPGYAGNAVFAGHRVTHSHPFRHIDRLVAGDLVHFDVLGRRSTYRVSGSQVVTPRDVWIVNPTPNATATLFACHPPGSARYRYVVRLELVVT